MKDMTSHSWNTVMRSLKDAKPLVSSSRYSKKPKLYIRDLESVMSSKFRSQSPNRCANSDEGHTEYSSKLRMPKAVEKIIKATKISQFVSDFLKQACKNQLLAKHQRTSETTNQSRVIT